MPLHREAEPEDDEVSAEYDPNDHTTWTREQFDAYCQNLREIGGAEVARSIAAQVRNLRLDLGDGDRDTLLAFATGLEKRACGMTAELDADCFRMYLRHFRAAVTGVPTNAPQTKAPRTLEEEVAATLAVYDARGDADGPGTPMTLVDVTRSIRRYMYDSNESELSED